MRVGNGCLCSRSIARRMSEATATVFAPSTLRTSMASAALSSSVASFDCLIADCHEVGSHSVFYCQVQAIRISEQPRGLVYFNRRYHAVGHDIEA